jgi:hypothetical protein
MKAMTPLAIESVGIRAPGLSTWPSAVEVLADRAPFVPGAMAAPVNAALPSTERRRANGTTRWALAAAGEAIQDLPPQAIAGLATVFASGDGDGEVLTTVLRDLAAEKVALSPTTFHNSVYNAPAGYWSIATRAPAASTTLCADAATVAAGFLEAAAQVAATGAQVLLVAYDLPFPPDAPIATEVRMAFACAVRLAPAGAASAALGRIDRMRIAPGECPALRVDLRAAFAHNAAARALAVLAAIARGAHGGVALPYHDGHHLAFEWTPGA